MEDERLVIITPTDRGRSFPYNIGKGQKIGLTDEQATVPKGDSDGAGDVRNKA